MQSTRRRRAVLLAAAGASATIVGWALPTSTLSVASGDQLTVERLLATTRVGQPLADGAPAPPPRGVDLEPLPDDSAVPVPPEVWPMLRTRSSQITDANAQLYARLPDARVALAQQRQNAKDGPTEVVLTFDMSADPYTGPLVLFTTSHPAPNSLAGDVTALSSVTLHVSSTGTSITGLELRSAKAFEPRDPSALRRRASTFTGSED